MSLFETLGVEALAHQLRDPTGTVGVAVADALGAINRDGNAGLLARLQFEGGDEVLEVGCGLATMAPAVVVAAPGIRYTGLDRSQTMAEAAHDRHAALVKAGDAQFLCAEVERMPFDAGSFSKAFSVGVIHFWSNPVRALTELRRVLRPGARIAMGGLGPERAAAFAQREYGFYLHTADEWRTFCRAAGFATVEVHCPGTPDGPQGMLVLAET